MEREKGKEIKFGGLVIGFRGTAPVCPLPREIYLNFLAKMPGLCIFIGITTCGQKPGPAGGNSARGFNSPTPCQLCTLLIATPNDTSTRNNINLRPATKLFHSRLACVSETAHSNKTDKIKWLQCGTELGHRDKRH